MSIEAAIETLAPSLQYHWSWDGPRRWSRTLKRVEAALAKLPPEDHDALIAGVRAGLGGWPADARGVPATWHAADTLAQHARALSLCDALHIDARHINASKTPPADTLAALLTAPQLQHLTALSIHNLPLKGALLDALCDHRPPGVTALSLRGCGLELAAVQAMCASDRLLVGLTSLDLRNNKINAKGAALLADCAHLSTLTTLNLRENPIAEAGRVALGKSPHLSSAAKISARAIATALVEPAPATGDVRAAFGDLRSILQQPPSPHAWAHICDLTSRLDPERAEQEALPYALSSLAAWPTAQRMLFGAWQEQVLQGEQVPPAALLARAMSVETKGLNAERAARVGEFAARAKLEHLHLFSSAPLSAKALRALLIEPQLSTLRSLRYELVVTGDDAPILFEEAPYKLEALEIQSMGRAAPRLDGLISGELGAGLRELAMTELVAPSVGLSALTEAPWWWRLRKLTLLGYRWGSSDSAAVIPALLGDASAPAWASLDTLCIEAPASLNLPALTPRLPALRSLTVKRVEGAALWRWLPELGQQLDALAITELNHRDATLAAPLAQLDMPALRALDVSCAHAHANRPDVGADTTRPNEALATLATSPAWRQLTSLKLGNIYADDAGLAAIIQTLPPDLHTLSLAHGRIGPQSAHALARQPLPHLRDLSLCYSAMSAEVMRALTDAPWWPQLDALHIEDHLAPSQKSGLVGLHDALPDRLRTLSIASNSEAHLLPLIKAGLPGSLRAITLRWGISTKAFAALIEQLPSLPDLHTLILDDNTVSAKAIEPLLSSPHLARIPLLSLRTNRLGFPGKQRILDTHAAPISLRSNV
jgi:Leucine-rich repeat (LRR) protein